MSLVPAGNPNLAEPLSLYVPLKLDDEIVVKTFQDDILPFIGCVAYSILYPVTVPAVPLQERVTAVPLRYLLEPAHTAENFVNGAGVSGSVVADFAEDWP